MIYRWRMFRNAEYALLAEIRPVSSARRRSPMSTITKFPLAGR
jgi:hypothetical protein